MSVGPELSRHLVTSDDLPAVVAAVREQLDALGALNYVASPSDDNFDGFTIARPLGRAILGVGTAVVTGSAAGSKLVAQSRRP